jgi:hypothetical protein
MKELGYGKKDENTPREVGCSEDMLTVVFAAGNQAFEIFRAMSEFKLSMSKRCQANSFLGYQGVGGTLSLTRSLQVV